MAIKTVGNLIPSTANTPLDARVRINSLLEVEQIENPYIGMTFFVIENKTYYIVKSLKSKELNGATVDDATIDEYEIIPSTSQVLGLIRNSEVTYTINGKAADDDGNFSINAEDIGGALENHIHDIDDIDGLGEAIDGKALADHTHDMLKKITVNNTVITDSIALEGSGNIIIDNIGNEISFKGEPFTVDIADKVPNANPESGKEIKLFIGTQEEWDAFTKDSSVDYLVFIID